MLAIMLAGALAAAGSVSTEALAYFQGSWTCQGHFIASLKPIASTMNFSIDDDTGATIKHQSDRPPGIYHATETWASAKGASSYRATIADAYSGLRWYTSAGWAGDVWTWTRSVSDGEPHEEFVYSRLATKSMQVDWRISKSGGPLEIGDTLTCIKS